MKKRKNMLGTAILAILTTSLMLPFFTQTVYSETSGEKPEVLPYGPNGSNRWTWIRTNKINIVFPTGGKKPMFLWWYANDTSNIYIVKYKGLIEFVTFDLPYYQHVYEATALKLQTMLNDRYFEPGQHRLAQAIRLRIQERLMQLAFWYGLHNPYLSFSGCRWNLTGPMEVSSDNPEYLSFNFTLVETPFPNLKFAENNVIIRCRFYYSETTEDVDGLYSYTVGAGELKTDLIVKNWIWNIDLIQPLLEELANHGIQVPVKKSGLALWINLASIPIEKIDLAEQDIEAQVGQVETQSMTQNMYVEGSQVSVIQNKTHTELEQLVTGRARLRERFKLRFQRTDATLTGFFKYVPKALVRDGENTTIVDVKASYISAGNHMRLFLSYPYFGEKTLEHDPSLGLEALPTLITPETLLILLCTVSIITVAILAFKWKRKVVNIVAPK